MKLPAITSTLLMTLSGILPVSAYSGIADGNGWSAAQLQDAGITIKPWENDKGRDIPAMRWVEISYDWRKMGETRHIEMTLYSGTKDHKAASVCRAEHRKAPQGTDRPDEAPFRIPMTEAQQLAVYDKLREGSKAPVNPYDHPSRPAQRIEADARVSTAWMGGILTEQQYEGYPKHFLAEIEIGRFQPPK